MHCIHNVLYTIRNFVWLLKVTLMWIAPPGGRKVYVTLCTHAPLGTTLQNNICTLYLKCEKFVRNEMFFWVRSPCGLVGRS
jgi:hypothetical protein